LALRRKTSALPSSSAMRSSISITFWFAPPCSGPHSALMPEAIVA
jgi:hypothetical protein